LKISVRITYETPFAKEIIESIKVDNVNIPKGMSIYMSVENENKILIDVSIEIEDTKNILTLRNTVDEIIQNIITLEKTLTKLSQKQ